MTKCTKCEIDKEEDEFPWKVKTVKRSTICKVCNRSYKTKYYNNNKEKVIAKSAECNIVIRNKLKQIINNIKSKGCLICKESEVVCLDFHHKDPEMKDYSVSQMISSSKRIDDIHKEIDKCVVLCSNCHRKLHAGLIQLAP